MTNEYNIKAIKKLKFNKRDIFILVSWDDMTYKRKPVIDEKFGTVIYSNRNSWYQTNHWTVKWKDSWIRITVLPDIQQRSLINDEIIICRS